MIFIFFEHIEFCSLSEEKLSEFLTDFDINQITSSLWQKLFQCFFIRFDKKPELIDKVHHSINEYSYEYNENEQKKFNIIFFIFIFELLLVFAWIVRVSQF